MPASQPVRVDSLTVKVTDTESIVLRCYHRERTTSRKLSLEEFDDIPVATQRYPGLWMLAVATMNLKETCMLYDKPLASSSLQQLQSLPVQTMSFLCVEWMKQTSNIFDNKDDPTKSLDMLGRW